MLNSQNGLRTHFSLIQVFWRPTCGRVFLMDGKTIQRSLYRDILIKRWNSRNQLHRLGARSVYFIKCFGDVNGKTRLLQST